MKKTIAILTVLILALTCVFAADPVATDSNGTATIKVYQLIKPVYPVFQIATDSANATKGNSATHTLTPDSLLTDDAEVDFSIYQVGTTKCFAKYDITVAAADMILMNDGLTAAATWTDVGLTEAQWNASVTKFEVDDTTPAVTAEDSIASLTQGVANFSASENVLKVQYLGGLKPADGEKELLGTFTCTWGKDALAIPGKYQANVTITITTGV